jgi:hypothetical protein
MPEMIYAVVEFVTNQLPGSVEIVPVRWLSVEEDLCKWPPCSSSEASKKIQKRVDVEPSWEEFPVRVLGKAGRHRCLVTSNSGAFTASRPRGFELGLRGKPSDGSEAVIDKSNCPAF